MIVLPYKRPPKPPVVTLLTPDGELVDEDGVLHRHGELPDTHRAFCSYDTVRELVNAGQGEALCWNGEEIRWRDRRYEEDWRNRPSDVGVLKLPFPDDPERTLAGLVAWRNWLRLFGAVPLGTTGGAAMSLLRATLEEPLFCSAGEPPPLRQTMGGRLELGPAGPGRFEGRLEQWDLPAAYAQEIGELRYGGRWCPLSELPVRHPLEWWARDHRPVFAHARVRVPEGLSVLIRRPRKRTTVMRLYLEGLTTPRFPSACEITGVWTAEELETAEQHGTRIMELREGWVHLGGRQLFAPWWQAAQVGRAMPGLAGLLAKMTANALWGRFCMDVQVQGSRTIRGRVKGRRSVQQRALPFRGGPKPAHDLAETVSGHVRARLYGAMLAAGDRLLSAHTDGIWTRALPHELEGWRRKMEATQLDLLDPQTLRYWPAKGRGEPVHVMAGRSFKEAPEAFARLWGQAGYGELAA